MSETGRPMPGTVFHPAPDVLTSGNGGIPRPASIRLSKPPRRRRPGMLALAFGMVCAGIVIVYGFVQRVDRQVQVLQVAMTVPAGQQISAADLTVVGVAPGPGVQVIPASQQPQVIGLVATTTLRAGDLLTTADVSTAMPPKSGQVLVPVAIHPELLPASGLVAGDQVEVVATPGAPGQQGAGGVGMVLTQPAPAVVVAVNSMPTADGLDVVDLIVPSGLGAQVAEQVSTGQFALIITGRVPR